MKAVGGLGWARMQAKISTVLPSPISSAKIPPGKGGGWTKRCLVNLRGREKQNTKVFVEDIIKNTVNTIHIVELRSTEITTLFVFRCTSNIRYFAVFHSQLGLRVGARTSNATRTRAVARDNRARFGP